MPELPEVETIVRRFKPLLTGRRAESFICYWKRQVFPSGAAVRRAIKGRAVAALGRRGKFIVIHWEGGRCTTIHLRMSGRLEWDEGEGSPRPAHIRAEWRFEDGKRLFLCDARKFARIRLTADLEAEFSHLGPEPLDPAFDVQALRTLLHGRSRRLKPALLDQSLIAGLGNIYTDEALFRAGLHPLSRTDRLGQAEITRLHQAIQSVLKEAIRHNGTRIDWVYPGGGMEKRLRVYGRQGKPCPACGHPILYMRVAQRGTHFCNFCQPFHDKLTNR